MTEIIGDIDRLAKFIESGEWKTNVLRYALKDGGICYVFFNEKPKLFERLGEEDGAISYMGKDLFYSNGEIKEWKYSTRRLCSWCFTEIFESEIMEVEKVEKELMMLKLKGNLQ